MLTGVIKDWDGHTLRIEALFDDSYLMVHQGCKECEIRLMDSRCISPSQRRKVFALLKDISLYTGYPPGDMKEVMKYAFLAKTGLPEFSLSDCELSVARQFIDFLIEFCLEWAIPCQDSLLEAAQDVGKYLYLCLYHRRCAICAKEKAYVHHCQAVGAGRNRKEIVHVGMPAMALCATHHNMVHSIGQATFDKKYHVFGITINEVLAKRLKLGRANRGNNNA